MSSNEWNQTSVEKIIMLMEEIAVLESRFEPGSRARDRHVNMATGEEVTIKALAEINGHDTENLRTAVSVLRNRVLELKEKVHG